jgi:hypothetical protein
MTIRSDQRMTTDSDSRGKEAKKEQKSWGFPSHIRRLRTNLLSIWSAFSMFGITFWKGPAPTLAQGISGQSPDIRHNLHYHAIMWRIGKGVQAAASNRIAQSDQTNCKRSFMWQWSQNSKSYWKEEFCGIENWTGREISAHTMRFKRSSYQIASKQSLHKLREEFRKKGRNWFTTRNVTGWKSARLRETRGWANKEWYGIEPLIVEFFPLNERAEPGRILSNAQKNGKYKDLKTPKPKWSSICFAWLAKILVLRSEDRFRKDGCILRSARAERWRKGFAACWSCKSILLY